MSGERKPDVERRDGVTVVSLGTEFENLDETILGDASTVILDRAADADPPLLVVHLPCTKFFGSAFIEVLFRAWNRLNGRPGGRFAISGLTSYCREVIEVTHLDQLWPLFDTVDEAVASLTGGSAE